MLIRSQDKEILVNFNVLAGIEIEELPVKTFIQKSYWIKNAVDQA